MIKFLSGFIAAAVLAAALGITGLIYARAQAPTTTQTPGYGGMMGGRGAWGGMGAGMMAGDQYGFMHDEMIDAFAQKLGISTADLNARLAKGETMYQIAASKGLTSDQFYTLMAEARSLALDQAVKDGKLTQQQADWMKQRGAGMMGGAGRGMRGRGAGQPGNSGCPYFNQTTP